VRVGICQVDGEWPNLALAKLETRFARWVNNKVAFKAMSWPEWCGTFKTTVPS